TGLGAHAADGRQPSAIAAAPAGRSYAAGPHRNRPGRAARTCFHATTDVVTDQIRLLTSIISPRMEILGSRGVACHRRWCSTARRSSCLASGRADPATGSAPGHREPGAGHDAIALD